jgi:hypothetical protein
MSKSLIIFHYFEKDASYRDNFLHFLAYGYSSDNDYIFIISGSHTLDLPIAENISYLFTENHNNDFGGYCHLINNGVNISKYDFFFFVNSSVRGPFLLFREHKHWTEYFIEQLDPEVGIVGSTINIHSSSSPYSEAYFKKYGGIGLCSHVQTTSYLLPRKSLLFLIDQGFYALQGILNKDEIILEYELKLSQLLKERGWNLKSLLPEYNQIDFRKKHFDVNPTSFYGDLLFKSRYFGRTVHPYEVIFIKTNRDLYSSAYLDRLTYSISCSNQLSNSQLNSKDLMTYGNPPIFNLS